MWEVERLQLQQLQSQEVGGEGDTAPQEEKEEKKEEEEEESDDDMGIWCGTVVSVEGGQWNLSTAVAV